MEGGESLFDTLFDEEDAQDVEMLDVEEGELTEHVSKIGEKEGASIEQTAKAEVGESFDVGGNQVNKESNRGLRRQKKRKNKRKRGTNAGPNITNINRFVLDACKRLREKKSYLMWNAVGCLGVSALSDLVKEVDAIKACGGQKTTDGSRFRSGGGILWNIIKARDPNAYKEIMKKGKEFENQLKQPVHDKQFPKQKAEAPSQSINLDANLLKCNPSGGLGPTSHDQSGQKRASSVHDRIRMPVTYDDDLFAGEAPKDELARLD